MTQKHRPTLYLANPYGFSEQARMGPLQDLKHVLEQTGFDVWEPFERNNQTPDASAGASSKQLNPEHNWAHEIAKKDVRDVIDADGFFAVVNGCPPDEGVMVELGIAIAHNKPIFLFRDDFRKATDNDIYPLNLMLFAGLGAKNWHEHYYTEIGDISNRHKGLAKWTHGEMKHESQGLQVNV